MVYPIENLDPFLPGKERNRGFYPVRKDRNPNIILIEKESLWKRYYTFYKKNLEIL